MLDTEKRYGGSPGKSEVRSKRSKVDKEKTTSFGMRLQDVVFCVDAEPCQTLSFQHHLVSVTVGNGGDLDGEIGRGFSVIAVFVFQLGES